MKTNEFMQKIEALSDKYEVTVTESTAYLLYDGQSLGYVERKIRFALHISLYRSVPKCQELYMLVTEFAGTPVGERDPKLYQVHIVKCAVDAYLYIDEKTNLYFVGEAGKNNFRSSFTQREIEGMKQTHRLAINWDEALEEVEDD